MTLNHYNLEIIMPDVPGAGTDEDIYIRFLLKDGQAVGDWLLDIPGWNDFERNDRDKYVLRTHRETEPNLADLHAIYLYVEQFKGSDDAPAWFPEELIFYSNEARPNDVVRFYLNRWIGISDRVPNGDSRCVNKLVISRFGELISTGVDPNPGQTFEKRTIVNGWREH
ncbi:PLAT/LH2 domain-containing protein [Paenibacillus polymyxa]|uniref:PLAT/LH2 domain-containing protein n=1 Tax=Paenibacillus polymyxa TaxID=1406 RepID=UPI00058A131B|nr:PLAT/LH2 domain-containing protein [Paenibacillus polymyxa]AJE54199.1 hypothetical protein RE92_24710 [Paenibacillus polymyxa]